ncbi:MAG: S8 family serine peptidase [Candidatus Contendobacter sp.]|nr:S8 family serine peptidase [Candidatus Contendobacter sp.]
MKHKTIAVLSVIALVATLLVAVKPAGADPSANGVIGVNVVLNTTITDSILAELGVYGKVRDVVYQVNAVTLQAKANRLPAIRALPFVAAANPDAMRTGAPVDTVFVDNFINGLSTWNLDAINVTDYGFDNRQVVYDGTGVYVAVLDTGLLSTWRQYFPQERIAIEYAKSFGGGGGEMGWVSSQPNKWEHDVNSHGTHVTSTILGYNLHGVPVNGVAPMATVIPVKVLNQNGSGWSSVIARGIMYIADLKAGPLTDYPVVINMSLGGPELDTVEKAAIDYAIDKGVIVVASAGNEGAAGMGYPGAYQPVISVAASGWIREWTQSAWWYAKNVADPTNPADFYITSFSSRELVGQDLDIAAPGSWVVGPYQLNNSNTPTYYYLGGTSMASPHVAGTVALMAQKYPALTAADAESILESSAIPLSAGCRDVYQPSGMTEQICWEGNATGAGLLDANAALQAIP